MIPIVFGFLAGVCFTFALFEIARITARMSERDEDRRVNAQRFDAPTKAGKV
jgi:hypothetical protein